VLGARLLQLARLLRGVHVAHEPVLVGVGRDPLQPLDRDGANAVRGHADADARAPGRPRTQLVHARQERVHVRVAEARQPAAVVGGGQQNDPQPRPRRLLRERHRRRVRRLVRRAVRPVVHVVELADRPVPRAGHLGIGAGGDGAHAVDLQPPGQVVHLLAPGPEVVVRRAGAFRHPPQVALERVRMHADHRRDAVEAAGQGGWHAIGAMSRPLRVLLVVAVLAVPAAAWAVTAADEEDPAAPAPTPSPTQTPAPPEDEPGPKRLTVAMSGDILPHLPVVERAAALAGGAGYDFAPMLRRLRPILRRADLALCHLEAPLAPGPPRGYPQFRAPPALARAIARTGWDACSVASNHTLDGGQAAIGSTLRALERADVRHTGASRSARARARTPMLKAEGVRVAFLAYTATTNGIPLPHPWSVNLADAGRIVRDARRARRRGADAVLVNLHWGTEYDQSPDAAQRRLARRLAAASEISAVFGQHAHVVQPIRRVRGRWTVFGAGNLLSNQTAACCHPAAQDGMVVLLHLRIGRERARVARVEYVPTWVRHPDFTVLPVRRGEDRPALRAAYRRTVGVVGRGPRLRPLPARLGER
jgi:poly-gamma-glutamate synthesis protein (capsule biosynthesis protein)